MLKSPTKISFTPWQGKGNTGRGPQAPGRGNPQQQRDRGTKGKGRAAPRTTPAEPPASIREQRDRAKKRGREERSRADQGRESNEEGDPGCNAPHNRTASSRDIWRRIDARTGTLTARRAAKGEALRAQRTAQKAQRAITDQSQTERLQEHDRGAPHNKTASSRHRPDPLAGSGADHPDPLAEVVRGAELTLGYDVEEADEEIEMLDEGPGEGHNEAPGQAPRD